MGDFAAGKMLDPVSVLLQLIEAKAPELHETLQPVPPATADALAAAPAALRPFLAAHDGGWEIYEYVLCSCAEMAPSAVAASTFGLSSASAASHAAARADACAAAQFEGTEKRILISCGRWSLGGYVLVVQAAAAAAA